MPSPQQRLITALLLSLLLTSEAYHFRLCKIWFKHKVKSACVVDIEGADLQHRSNRYLHRFGSLLFPFSSKPDPFVVVRHVNAKVKTQILGNRLRPRWYFREVMPFYSERGFHFTVFDANVFERDSVIGRAWIGPLAAAEMIESGNSALLSLGHGIGTIKVKISRPANLKGQLEPLDKSRVLLTKVRALNTL